VIDHRFYATEILLFHNFLIENSLICKVLVFYNECILTQNEINFLKKRHIVDDIIPVHNKEINFQSKISFLKKVKEYCNGSEQKNMFAEEGKKRNFLSAKRIIDITAASLALLLLSPVFLMIALLVKFDSRGPVFYNALRAGKGYRVFRFHKFRTMVADADKKLKEVQHLNQYSSAGGNGPVFLKVDNDPRITRLGRFLRKTSLDELPQLFNVLKGDMSLVGNRPLPLYEAAELTTNEFVERFMAPAGITGLWQVKKRGGKTEMSVEERISLDIQYARNASPMMDLWIMALTPTALFQKSNA
jgi:lipopolysaccharide/colanic/teichoic acid biosynthesis glycosyltransferase